ncbi:hypothetical protein FG93_01164 [Bosea sp. LC85]|uniref:carboxymuconolactone decarboxylase family protein n=1 Tax=Bosea sp. LC85 TaxID=1502851 RepID=UPI0004E45AC7|nr:carboxymuconolactone decarboxylase family protein [Bosea sp. LC85]KFC74578.1 hypothetical protein FG93_01164 [Bosea sp. LC85]
MKMLGAALVSLCAITGAEAQTPDRLRALAETEIGSVSPALEAYTRRDLLGEVWKRPGLSRRDRSVVTIAALIAKGQSGELPRYLSLALDNGVEPSEISEIITHLAFYSSWGNGMAAVTAARAVFAERSVSADRLPPAEPQLLPLDAKAEASREERVQADVGAVSPGLVRDTSELLFKDLWLRPGLSPRDRSLITVTSLIANGQVAQMGFHLARAMDNGLTREQAAEVISHLAFYAGWPNAFSAVPIAKTVFEARKR